MKMRKGRMRMKDGGKVGMGMQMGGPMAIMPAPGMMPGMNMGNFMTAPQPGF